MTLRADKFEILRKKPAHDAYDFSFLIAEEHLLKFKKEELINFILEFVQGIDKEISEMKLSVINHSRMAACFFTNGLANNKLEWKKSLSCVIYYHYKGMPEAYNLYS